MRLLLGLDRKPGYAFPMRNTFVPQVGQEPCIAGRPFFRVICLTSLISTFFRHFIQYAVAITPSSR